jgi:fatty-acyl-CoA synthase
MRAWFEGRRFGDLPWQAAQQFGDREGLIFNGRRHSFQQIDAEVDLAARALMAEGVQAGDHVALWLNNSDDWIFIMYAVAKIGAVLVPINTRFRNNDLEYVLRQSDSAVLITHDVSGPIDYLDMVRSVVVLPEADADTTDANFPELRKVVILGRGVHPGVVNWNEAKASANKTSVESLDARAASVSPDDVALIMYTSGTTGFPKGAMHSHISIRNVEERAYRMAITVNDGIMAYLPLFHVFGFSECAMMALVTGARLVMTETFDPAESLDLAESEGATLIHGFEAHIKMLCEEQERRARNLSHLRTGIFAAGPCSAIPILRRSQAVFPTVRPVSGFGMTETWIGAAFSALDDPADRRLEASGYPGLGYDIRVADPDTGIALDPDVEGELQVRGRYMMLGYYKKPDETKAAYTDDGWFRTGDAGVWRDDGYVRFLGRYKDMLKVGGENVDPMEVEGFLLDNPGVHQVAVVGCPDARLEEVAVAYVQRAEGVYISAEEIIKFCRNKVASFKIPRHVVFVDDFPMTASGKIRKVDLRADALKRFGD